MKVFKMTECDESIDPSDSMFTLCSPTLRMVHWSATYANFYGGTFTTARRRGQGMYWFEGARKWVNNNWGWIPRIPGGERSEDSVTNYVSNPCSQAPTSSMLVCIRLSKSRTCSSFASLALNWAKFRHARSELGISSTICSKQLRRILPWSIAERWVFLTNSIYCEVNTGTTSTLHDVCSAVNVGKANIKQKCKK